MWIVFIVLIVVEAVLVLKWKVSTNALIYYMELKKYTQPNSTEMEVCTAYVVRQMFKV